MRKRLWSLTAAALTVLASVGAINGCSHRNGDVNRVVDPYWNKADFDGEHVWYYRSTVVDTAPGSSFINGTVGDGDWLLLERLRWEVTEHYLMGASGWNAAQGDALDGIPVTLLAGTYFTAEGGNPTMWPYDGLVSQHSAWATDVPEAIMPIRATWSGPLTHSIFCSHAVGADWQTALTWNVDALARVAQALDEA